MALEKKTLIAVKSCARDIEMGCHQPIRDSWGWHASKWADVRFFVGDGKWVFEPDEIQLVGAPDYYRGLSEKVNHILRWALNRDYESIVLVDTDTFLVPHRLQAVPLSSFDYFGMMLPWHGGFMFGGCGFAISRDAANIIVNNPVADPMDDISIGKILLHRPQPDIRVAPYKWHRYIGWHFPKNTYAASKYDPRFPWMQLMAEKHLGEPQRIVMWSTAIGGATRTVQLELNREDRESL